MSQNCNGQPSFLELDFGADGSIPVFLVVEGLVGWIEECTKSPIELVLGTEQ